MMGNNMCFKGVIWLVIPKLSLLLLLIWSTDFCAGSGAETFPYLKIINRQIIKVISSQTPAPLILVTKLTFNGI